MGSSPIVRTSLIALALLAAGCGQRRDSGPVVVSVIGERAARFADPSRGPMRGPDRVLTASVAQGLVRFDAAGQIEPGLAERWIVLPDGMSYIFRLRRAEWNDGKPVTAQQVATILKREALSRRNGPLAPYLTAIADVVVMTPSVIEVRLDRPRPDLLKLFAQPELALLRLRPPGGSGPLKSIERGDGILLRPSEPRLTEDGEPIPYPPEADVRLYGERAAQAVIRFARRKSDLVLGGRFTDWPLVAAAEVAPANIRVDPAAGLFGLAVANRDGLFADAANRRAVAGLFDGRALATVIGAAPAASLLPERLDAAAAPAAPAWAGLPVAERRAAARAQIAAWRAGGGSPLVRVALPDGPGARLLWAQLAVPMLEAGLEPVRVPLGDRAADLRLIDAVAPYDSARWYLNTACVACSPEAAAAIEAARLAPTSAARARALAEADAALAADDSFILLGSPLRWSLVALRLRAFQGNSRAWHPLNHLRNDPD